MKSNPVYPAERYYGEPYDGGPSTADELWTCNHCERQYPAWKMRITKESALCPPCAAEWCGGSELDASDWHRDRCERGAA